VWCIVTNRFDVAFPALVSKRFAANVVSDLTNKKDKTEYELNVLLMLGYSDF